MVKQNLWKWDVELQPGLTLLYNVLQQNYAINFKLRRYEKFFTLIRSLTETKIKQNESNFSLQGYIYFLFPNQNTHTSNKNPFQNVHKPVLNHIYNRTFANAKSSKGWWKKRADQIFFKLAAVIEKNLVFLFAKWKFQHIGLHQPNCQIKGEQIKNNFSILRVLTHSEFNRRACEYKFCSSIVIKPLVEFPKCRHESATNCNSRKYYSKIRLKINFWFVKHQSEKIMHSILEESSYKIYITSNFTNICIFKMNNYSLWCKIQTSKKFFKQVKTQYSNN